MLQKLLCLICLVFFTGLSVKAQESRLSEEEEEEEKEYQMNLCIAIAGSRQIAGISGIQPTVMKIISFTRSSTGKIDRIRGHYDYTDKNAWLELFCEDDLAYGVVYSDDSTWIAAPRFLSKDGTVQSHKGAMLSRVKALQKILYTKLENERQQAQQLALKKSKEDFSGEQTYDGAKNDVPEDVFEFVKKCVDECLQRSEEHIFSNTLFVKVMSKDAVGKHTKLRADFLVRDWGAGKTYPEWAEILFDNNRAYVMYLATGKLHDPEPGEIDRHITKYYSTPLARWHKPETVYSADELVKIKQLQEKFFLREKAEDDKLFTRRYMVVLKKQQEEASKQNNQQTLKCLEKAETTKKVRSGYATQTEPYFEGGYRLEREVRVAVYKTIKVPALKNVCKSTVYIYGMEKYADNGEGDDIKYRSVIMTLEPGDVTEYIYIAPGYDDTKIKAGERLYYSKPQAITITGIK